MLTVSYLYNMKKYFLELLHLSCIPYFVAQWASENEMEASLPGFESYTPQQMFWISYGQVWCIKYRDAALKKQIETAPHSPGRYRIIGPMSNIEEFSRDFNCPVGSEMNPEKKCQVW